jgi:hypothetical protein
MINERYEYEQIKGDLYGSNENMKRPCHLLVYGCSIEGQVCDHKNIRKGISVQELKEELA